MKYIIMCGGTYLEWQTPRQLLKINGEEIVARTIRQLRRNHVRDIAISSNDPVFERFGVPVLHHENGYTATHNKVFGSWLDAFYPTDKPVCYIFGDVVFSDAAIKRIVKTRTKSIDFFASAPPFAEGYIKPWAEPFALKVKNTALLRDAVNRTKKIAAMGLFRRQPIMWELWQVITDAPLNHIDYHSYININDYTCDVDDAGDAEKIEMIIERESNECNDQTGSK